MLFCSKPSERQFSERFHSREEIPCAQREKNPTKKKTPKKQPQNPKTFYHVSKLPLHDSEECQSHNQ